VLKKVLPIERRSNILDTHFKNSNQFKKSYFKYFIIRYQLKNFFLNFEIGGGAVLLLWANTLSPFGINRQTWSLLRALFYFLSMVQINMSEDYTKVESGAE
jgi:hypothetical protein